MHPSSIVQNSIPHASITAWSVAADEDAERNVGSLDSDQAHEGASRQAGFVACHCMARRSSALRSWLLAPRPFLRSARLQRRGSSGGDDSHHRRCRHHGAIPSLGDENAADGCVATPSRINAAAWAPAFKTDSQVVMTGGTDDE